MLPSPRANDLAELLGGARAYDLAQPYFVGMPHYPTHPPFCTACRRSTGLRGGGRVSSASEALALGSHTGTHMDALSHYSRAATARRRGGGGRAILRERIGHLSIDTVAW